MDADASGGSSGDTDLTVDVVVRRAAAEHGDAPFLVTAAGSLTYQDLEVLTRRVAHGFAERGIEAGDHVAILMSNRLEWVLAWFGAARAGIPVVAANAGLRGAALAHVLAHSEAVAVVVEAELLPALDHLDVNGDGGPPAVGRRIVVGDARGGGESFDDLLRTAGTVPTDRAAPADPMLLMYSSGTTGLPKGVVIPQSRVRGGRTVLELCGVTSADRLYTCLPLFHANAALISLTGALRLGTSLHLARRFSASRFWDEIRAADATVFNALGSMLSILHKQSPSPHDTANPARLVVSAACPITIWEDFEQRFGVDIVELYGTVEGGLTIASPDSPVGSIGRPVPGTEMKVIRDDGSECAPGEVGELLSRPLGGVAQVAYYRDDDAARAKTREGWLHTGDRAYRDDDGWLWFVDRAAHFIRRRGENISSAEIERVVDAHPDVLESAAYPLPSELGEDDVAVMVVLRTGASLAPAELVRYLAPRLPGYQLPRYIRLASALPKTATHRAQKTLLSDEGVTDDTWDRDGAATT